MYDFANSLLIVNGSLYFTQWIAIDNHAPDAWLSASFIISTLLLFAIMPFTGVLLDRRGNRYSSLLWFTIATAACGILIQVFGLGVSNVLGRVLITLTFYTLLNFFYQISLFVYNTYLKDLVPSHAGASASGIGFGIGNIGSIVGLLITYPIIAGWVPALGHTRVSMLIPMAILFLVVAWPMLRWARSIPETTTSHPRASYGEIYRSIWRDIKETRKYPGVTRFLISFYFFSDAQLTIFLFAAIYLDRVLGASDAAKIIIFIEVLVAMAVGSFVGGAVGDRIGGKKVYLVSLLIDAIAMLAVAAVPNMTLYYVLFALYGLSAGGAYAVSRSLLSDLIPYTVKGQFFSLYSLFERFASILGPIVWGVVVGVVTVFHALNYRLAASAMGVFVLIAAWIAYKLPKPTSPPDLPLSVRGGAEGIV